MLNYNCSKLILLNLCISNVTIMLTSFEYCNNPTTIALKLVCSGKKIGCVKG